ncbi:MAG: T9SS type A sorting domain-containing protein [Bacteroidia bacterium]|nr:T9SS type A sorting domain-containing protein [Bacteroidia bacterium]
MRNRSFSVFLLICFWGISLPAFAQELALLKKTKVRSLQDLELLLEQHVPELGTEASHLELLHFKESPAAYHYLFRQLFKEIPINGSELSVHIDKQGQIRSFSKQLYSLRGQKLPSFSFPKSKLHTSMSNIYGAYSSQIEAQLLWDKGKLIPIYRLHNFSHGSVYQFEVLVDAEKGKEISWKDLGLYHTETTGDTTGRARVFKPNPCTKANVNYGDLFIDSMDFHKTIFESLMDSVVLEGLCIEGDSFLLKGPYVEITDLEAPAVPSVKSIDGDFYFRRDESGFEQVMAYYHIDRMQRWVRSIGFGNIQTIPIKVDAQGTESDNSVTVIKDSVPNILFGRGGVDDAEDADVIIHEYGHALSYFASGVIAKRGSRERLGLDEGIGDYLAAIYSQDLGFDNYRILFNWDGHNEFWPGRQVSASDNYPPQDSSIHDFGGIWASTLLDLRNQIGKGLIDSLFFQSLFFNDLNTDLPTAAQHFLMADSLLFEGAHTEAISFTFCQKGLLPDLNGDCSVVSVGESLKDFRPKVFPNPNSGIFFLELNPSTNPEARLEVFNELGQIIFRQEINQRRMKVDLAGNSPGLYFLKIQATNGQIYAQKVILE